MLQNVFCLNSLTVIAFLVRYNGKMRCIHAQNAELFKRVAFILLLLILVLSALHRECDEFCSGTYRPLTYVPSIYILTPFELLGSEFACTDIPGNYTVGGAPFDPEYGQHTGPRHLSRALRSFHRRVGNINESDLVYVDLQCLGFRV